MVVALFQIYFHVISADGTRANGNVIYPHIWSQVRPLTILTI